MRKPLPVTPKLLLAYGVYTVLVSVHLAWALKAMEWPWVVLAGGGGWVFWTFFEYLLHRWGFHEPPGAPAAHKYDIHWDHHRVPQDPERIITSLWLSLPIAALFWGLLWLIAQGHPIMGAVYAGIGVGYLGYETLHYLMHVRPVPPFRFLRKLWRHHYLHHYKEPNRYYGVTVRWWDYVFGTA